MKKENLASLKADVQQLIDEWVEDLTPRAPQNQLYEKTGLSIQVADVVCKIADDNVKAHKDLLNADFVNEIAKTQDSASSTDKKQEKELYDGSTISIKVSCNKPGKQLDSEQLKLHLVEAGLPLRKVLKAFEASMVDKKPATSLKVIDKPE